MRHDDSEERDNSIRARAADALEFLASMLRSSADLDRVIDGYLEARVVLASAFRNLAMNSVSVGPRVLASAVRALNSYMASHYQDIPAEHLQVRGFNETHELLLSYLAQRMGKPVPASRLRIVSGDQVHTERRVRDLRDLGFKIEAKRVAGEFSYVLTSIEQDIAPAAFDLVRANIGRTGIAESEKYRLMAMMGNAPR